MDLRNFGREVAEARDPCAGRGSADADGELSGLSRGETLTLYVSLRGDCGDMEDGSALRVLGPRDGKVVRACQLSGDMSGGESPG